MIRRLLALALVIPLLGASTSNDASTLGAMQSELARNGKSLALPNQKAPYFMAYWTVDYEQHDARATLGHLVSTDRDHGRRVHVEVRVGDRQLDNSNFMDMRGNSESISWGTSPDATWPAPELDPTALKHVLWLATDTAYKAAVGTLEQKNASRRMEVSSSDDVASFSTAPVAELVAPPARSRPDSDADERLVERASAVFREFPAVQDSDVSVSASCDRRFFVSSEGGRIAVSTASTSVTISASTQADDGMALSLETSLLVPTATPPAETQTVAEARRIAGVLDELRNAPVLEDYSGPVLFEGVAAPQILHELLADALSGTPAPKGAEWFEGPLARKLGKRILPSSFSVFDDPTLERFEGHSLLGHYLVDDEGVVPQRTVLVEHGRLKAFLMSRTPNKAIPNSNGHGRSGLAGWARGRVGNLVVQNAGGLPEAALVARLLRAVKDDGMTRGLVVSQLEPRSSSTNGQAPPAPQIVYEVGLDGKRRLVRGGRFGQMSIRDLRDILAAGTDLASYDYAEPTADGFAIPASVVAPALLFEDVEVKRRSGPNKHTPVVSRPSLAGQ